MCGEISNRLFSVFSILSVFFIVPSVEAQLGINTDPGCPTISYDSASEEIRIEYADGEIIFDIQGANRFLDFRALDSELGVTSSRREERITSDIIMTHLHLTPGASGVAEVQKKADAFLGADFAAAAFPDEFQDQYYLVFMNLTGIQCEVHEGAAPLSLPGTTIIPTGFTTAVNINDTLIQRNQELAVANDLITELETKVGLGKDEMGRCLQATSKLIEKVNERESFLNQCKQKRDSAIEITNLLYGNTKALGKDLRKFRKENDLSSTSKRLIGAVLKRIRKILKAAVQAAEESRK